MSKSKWQGRSINYLAQCCLLHPTLCIISTPHSTNTHYRRKKISRKLCTSSRITSITLIDLIVCLQKTAENSVDCSSFIDFSELFFRTAGDSRLKRAVGGYTRDNDRVIHRPPFIHAFRPKGQFTLMYPLSLGGGRKSEPPTQDTMHSTTDKGSLQMSMVTKAEYIFKKASL